MEVDGGQLPSKQKRIVKRKVQYYPVTLIPEDEYRQIRAQAG